MTPDEAFIRDLPKTDLHMHLEGSMEPETMLEMARRNGIGLRWGSPEALRAAYEFEGLSSFLDLYFEACRVLQSERDFHDVTAAYLRRARQDGVIHAEIFFGPQTFLDRNIPIAAMMDGILGAFGETDISAGLLVSVHRHRSEAEAFEVLRLTEPWADRVLGIGMGGAELGNPPSKFVDFFAACRAAGFRTTVHAGEEGPPAYVREAIDLLRVSRIDHGVAAAQDPALVADLAARGIPLTVCPLSNLRLKVVDSLAAHPLKALLDAGVCVTVNSDDPPYFGGWVTENLVACRQALGLSRGDILRLVRNGFAAAFMSDAERATALERLDAAAKS
ncbi:MAG TPA: adenosine deaminase [Stellaceae bacterium]